MPITNRAGLVGLALSAWLVSTPTVAASTTTYVYDALGQLVTVTSTAGRSTTYTYDTAGNRTNMAATGTISLNTPSTRSCLSAVACPEIFRSVPSAPSTPFYAEVDSEITATEPKSGWGVSGGLGVRALR
jgi:YD repeat-containing protein